MSLILPSFQSNKILRRFCKTFQNHISSYENPSKYLKITSNDINNSQAKMNHKTKNYFLVTHIQHKNFQFHLIIISQSTSTIIIIIIIT